MHFTPLTGRTQNPWSLCEIGQILVGLPHPARIRAWWLNSNWSCWGKRLVTYFDAAICNKSTTLLCQDAQSPYDSIVPGHQYRRSVAAVQHQIVGDHQSSTEWTSWRTSYRDQAGSLKPYHKTVKKYVRIWCNINCNGNNYNSFRLCMAMFRWLMMV